MRELHEAMVLTTNKIFLLKFIIIEVILFFVIYYIRFIHDQIDLTIYTFSAAVIVNLLTFFIALMMVLNQMEKVTILCQL